MNQSDSYYFLTNFKNYLASLEDVLDSFDHEPSNNFEDLEMNSRF